MALIVAGLVVLTVLGGLGFLGRLLAGAAIGAGVLALILAAISA